MDISNKRRLDRRAFIGAAGLAALTLAIRPQRLFAADAAKALSIVPVSPSGELLPATSVDKIVKSDAEWKAMLSPLSYQVTRHEGTERSFSGAYWNLEDKGLFRCICCDTALFSSKTKFDSGTGWPSFWQPIAKQNVHEITDRSAFMTRTAVSCARCDAHLGHVFDDGPRPTGLRYCMNSVSLKFAKFT